jgi:voltage-gated potassium channel
VGWALPLELYLFVYFTSWPLMAWAEPDARIADADVYWYWFVVTTATVGFGDHHPTTTAGQAVSMYVIVGGIVTITTVFTRLSQMIENTKGRRMAGHQHVQTSGHLVILGYAAGRTEGIIDTLLAEEHRVIVVCAWDDQASQHPMAHREHVHFVRGNLTDSGVLERASLGDAAHVLVDARDDDEALKVAVAVHHVNAGVHTVVSLHDLAHARTVSMVAKNAWCVQWHSPELISEELHDVGMSEVYRELMTTGDRNTYSITVPPSLPNRAFGDYQQALGRWNAATILAVRTPEGLQVSPSWRDEVPVGATLYYVARRRLRPQELERQIDRSERALVFSDREMLRAEWH